MNRIATVIGWSVLAFMSTTVAAQEMATVAVIGTGDMGTRSARDSCTGISGRTISRTCKRQVVALVARTGHGARATTQKEAAQAGDIFFTLVTRPAMETVAQNLAISLARLSSTSMPFEQGPDGIRRAW